MPDAALVPTPERSSESALARLVDVLLDKGVVLDLDLLVTVAGVPLIAVNLRATIAGVETMLDYGVPGVWADVELQRGLPAGDRPSGGSSPASAPRRLPVRLRELRATGPIWRDGDLLVDPSGLIRWYGADERRPALRLEPGEVRGMRQDRDPDVGPVLVLRADSGAHILAPADPQLVATLLAEVAR